MRPSRRDQILQCIVASYIHNPQPVSSSMVATGELGVNLSSATIRAVMAELEREGFLTQPHKSAGRIPTARGIRAYLDHFVEYRLHPWDRNRLDAAALCADSETAVTQLGQALSALSGQMAVVTVPAFAGSRLREVGLVRLDNKRVLAYFISLQGTVQQKLVPLDFDPSPCELAETQNFINSQLAQKTLTELRTYIQAELEAQKASCGAFHAQMMHLSQKLLPIPSLKIIVEGTTQLLEQPEFTDVTTLRALLRTIEEKQRVLRLLDGLLDGRGVQVMLGSAHAPQEMQHMAYVGCGWSKHHDARAAISLWGARRMDYGRVMPLIHHACHVLAHFWDRI